MPGCAGQRPVCARSFLCAGCGDRDTCSRLVQAKRSVAPLSTEKHNGFSIFSSQEPPGASGSLLGSWSLPDASQEPSRGLSDASQEPPRCFPKYQKLVLAPNWPLTQDFDALTPSTCTEFRRASNGAIPAAPKCRFFRQKLDFWPKSPIIGVGSHIYIYSPCLGSPAWVIQKFAIM